MYSITYDYNFERRTMTFASEYALDCFLENLPEGAVIILVGINTKVKE